MRRARLIESAKQGTAVVLSLCLLWTSGNIAQAAEVAPEVFVSASNLPQFRLIPPGQFGRIADYFNSTTNDSKLLVLIQDLHAHYGVQKNTSGILDFLAKKLSKDSSTTVPFALAVEGAQGPVDSSALALFPDQKIRAQAADYLMREGELTGAEHFAVMRGIPNLLVGVEDEQYYNLNRELFRKTLADRQELVSLLKGLEADIAPLQDRIYGQALGDFQKKADAYDKGEMSTHDFIALLTPSPAAAGGGSIDLKHDFPTLASFSANSRFGTIDQIRAATSEFLTQTQGLLSAEEKMDLKSLAKNGSTTPYYLYMRDLVYKKQLFLAVPPELAQYLEYIHTAQTMGMDRVTHEARELAFQIKLRLAHEGQEKDLVQVQHDLDLLTRIADLQATEYEVKDFGPRLNQFVALCKSLMESNGIRSFDETKVRSLISSSIDYYAMALMRNKPMIDNTLSLIGRNSQNGRIGKRAEQPNGRISQSRSPSGISAVSHFRHPVIPTSGISDVAVLVAGGFHTSPLTELLRQRNISYIVITPTVESLTEADHDLYVKRLNGDLLTVGDVLSDANAWSSSTFAKVSQTGYSADSLTPGTLGKAIGVGVIAAVIFGISAHVAGHAPNLAYFDIFTHLHSAWTHLSGIPDALTHLKEFLAGHAAATGSAALAMIPPMGHPQNPWYDAEGGALRLQEFEDLLNSVAQQLSKSRGMNIEAKLFGGSRYLRSGTLDRV